MGKIDMTMKDYFSDKRRYADLWNGGVFGGEQLLWAEELQVADTVVSGRGKKEAAERTCDVVMRQVLGKQTFALWILENQQEVDYSMPVRIMLDEALEYHKQIRKIKRRNREESQKHSDAPYYKDDGEFLYRFRVEDRLFPVITLVVYWGGKEWCGPRDLHQMIDFNMGAQRQDGRLTACLHKLVPDYPIHILNLSEIEDYSCFQTELRVLFEMYACRNSKEKFRDYIESHEECRHMDEDTCHMLGIMTHFEELQTIKEKEDGEGINVCKAILDMINDGKIEGKIEGRTEGLIEGNASGENRMVQLTRMLLDQNRMKDLTRALEDAVFRNELFGEYHLV